MRFISVSARPVPHGPGGGSGGVCYRLMRANEKYRLFEDAVFIFSDTCISASEGEISVGSAPQAHQLIEFERYFRQLDEALRFCEDDSFVFHDLESFCAMKQSFSQITRTLVMFHQQGSIYSEYIFMGNEPDKEYEQFCFELTRVAVDESELFGFPSIGAKQALIATLPEIGPYLENKKDTIIYNGCSPVLSAGTGAIEPLIGMMKNVKGNVFITVATLNEAKGVERLPAFFKEYGKYVEDYFWIVIGNGAKAGELSQGLSDLEGHVLWLDVSIDNSDIIRLYDKADYYILSHRYSIFDFATIEAMHMGCVPVLTPVGGNLEMITGDNGYFLDDDLSAKGFVSWEKEHDIAMLKEENRRIAQERFSELSMLKAYRDVVNAM